MRHAERVAFAQQIAARMVTAYGDALVAVAAFGSVARGDDTDTSDLELWAAFADDPPVRERYVAVRGMAVQIEYRSVAAMLDEARTVDRFWPINAAQYGVCLPLHGRGDFFAQLAGAVASPHEEGFAPALRETMRRMSETAGKARSNRTRGDTHALLKAGRGLVHEAMFLIGLANRRYFPHTRDLYRQAAQLPLRPEGYAELLDIAGNFTTTDADAVYAAAMVLWGRVQAFAHAQGIEWEDAAVVV